MTTIESVLAKVTVVSTGENKQTNLISFITFLFNIFYEIFYDILGHFYCIFYYLLICFFVFVCFFLLKVIAHPKKLQFCH